MIYVKKLKEQENAKIIISLLLKKMTLHCMRIRFTYYMYFIYMTVPFLDRSAINKIPKSTESIVLVGMYLCQIHLILNEIRDINMMNTIIASQQMQINNQKNLILKKFQED